MPPKPLLALLQENFMVFRVLKSSISLWASSANETEYKLSDNLVQALTLLILAYFAFFCCLSFSSVFFLAGGGTGVVYQLRRLMRF